MKSLKELSDLLLLNKEPEDSNEIICDMCSCEECGWEGKVDDCEKEWEQEGWEYPRYQVVLCPKCEDGGVISDFWPSDEQLKIWEEKQKDNT